MIKSYSEFKRMNEAIELPAEGETIQPKSRKELIDIIKLAIKERGNEVDLNFIDTSKITDMSWLFHKSIFDGDISKWDVSNVEDMNSMFWDSKFNGDISKWNVSKVEDMYFMFWGSIFKGDISKWDVSKVKGMPEMFGKSPLKNKPEYQPVFQSTVIW